MKKATMNNDLHGFTDAWKPDVKQRQAALKPDNEHTLPFRDAYRNVAPKPENWPLLIEKVKAMWAGLEGWPQAEMRSLKAPLMVMLGDDDFIRPEHALGCSEWCQAEGSQSCRAATIQHRSRAPIESRQCW